MVMERSTSITGELLPASNLSADARLALHSGCFPSRSIIADVLLAQRAGYQGIELSIPKLGAYLDAGHSIADLRRMLGGLTVTMVDVIMPIERLAAAGKGRSHLLELCERMARTAAGLACNALQVVALSEFETREVRSSVVKALRALSEVAAPHGVRLALEPVCFSPFRALRDVIDVVHEVGPERVSIVLDTFHLWASGTSVDEISAIDPALVETAQIGDATWRAQAEWSDDDRGVLPGDGVLPLREIVAAIVRTGFRGWWSAETFGEHRAKWDPTALALELRTRAHSLIESTAGETQSTDRRPSIDREKVE